MFKMVNKMFFQPFRNLFTKRARHLMENVVITYMRMNNSHPDII